MHTQKKGKVADLFPFLVNATNTQKDYEALIQENAKLKKQNEELLLASSKQKEDWSLLYHDIGNLAFNIQGLLDRCVNRNYSDHELLDSAAGTSAYISKLLKGILLAGSNAEAAKSKFSLSNLLTSLSMVMDKHFAIKDRSLYTSIQPDLWIEAVEVYVISIVTNLLDNAKKFSPVKSTTSLELFVQNRYAVISVINSGEQIPVDKLNEIFLLYKKLSNDGCGHGLGLGAVSFYVEKLGGFLQLTSNPETSTFKVFIPL